MVDQTYRNIVVIGASAAGHTLANELIPILPGGYRILLIDALEYSFWTIGALRAAVVPGWEEKIVLPLRTSTCFPHGSVHEVIAPNRVVELRKGSVVLERPFEGSVEVPFLRAILATGSIQPSPMRPSSGWSKEEYMAALRKSQEDLKNAKALVIVGGGPVGIEFAGEVRSAYPDKEITLIHNRSTLLSPISEKKSGSGRKESSDDPSSWASPPTHLKLSNTLTSLVKAQNVRLILDDKVIIPDGLGNTNAEEEWEGSFGLQSSLKVIKTENGQRVKADYIFLSVGNKPNSAFVRGTDPNAVEGSTGLVKVDEYLRVKSSILGDGNYYAIGDVNNAQGMKTSYLATIQAKSAATNIVNEINNKLLIPYIPGTFSGLFIPFGPEIGAGSLTFPYLGTWTVGNGIVRTAKGRKLLLDKWGAFWKGKEKVDIII
ncbi:hypothetical protein I302_104157 [Kwoniella bestiolae CBS 10118]|uniref:FAD/NAD(P)-binding domain-containing protein n=1 Tax=Kwoniella bestiolae CBS 10118 TaxID=1296100 RepID=A0AAJ8M8E4_9TREE